MLPNPIKFICCRQNGHKNSISSAELLSRGRFYVFIIIVASINVGRSRDVNSEHGKNRISPADFSYD